MSTVTQNQMNIFNIHVLLFMYYLLFNLISFSSNLTYKYKPK